MRRAGFRGRRRAASRPCRAAAAARCRAARRSARNAVSDTSRRRAVPRADRPRAGAGNAISARRASGSPRANPPGPCRPRSSPIAAGCRARRSACGRPLDRPPAGRRTICPVQPLRLTPVSNLIAWSASALTSGVPVISSSARLSRLVVSFSTPSSGDQSAGFISLPGPADRNGVELALTRKPEAGFTLRGTMLHGTVPGA